MKNIWILPLLVFLSACGSSTGINLGPYYNYGPTKNNFKVCHGYSCQFQTTVNFTDKEWNNILKPLKYDFKTSKEERKQLAKVIGDIEKLSGLKSGTNIDLAEASGTRENDFQMDCIDETVNISLQMKFIEKYGVLKFHKFERTVHRGYFIDGAWPHNAIAIRDVTTDKLYVLDSFYKSNGKAPYVIPLQEWLDGWRPNKND